MAPTDPFLLITLRLLTSVVGGIVTGLLLSGPLLITPVLFTFPLASARIRLHLYSRLTSETTSLSALLLPVLTASLGLCAILVQSADGLPASPVASSSSLTALIAENRKTLYTLSAVLIVALKPYTFGLLLPRIELLKAEEKRVLLLRSGVNGVGAKKALGAGIWRGASPADSGDEGGNELDEEDNAFDEGFEEGGARSVVSVEKVDTDALISELSHLQLGCVVLAGSSFALTLLELCCA
ncbi:hypothetical protein JCM11251_003097 [Rhodosporidiobolus azoricus]